ncbi:MAG TPA: lipoprotein insertase outer membrane protein LolB [Burkholderiales bacterium]|nr:lipoprotein insertase outer membrane protein LolB [Burkholderiales bacterium]
MNRAHSCAALAAAASLAGCALIAPAPPAPPAPAFDLVGRVAVTYDARAFTSGVRWQHTALRDELWLMTPAGQALAHIVGDAGGAIFTGADRREYRAADIASLIRRALGWEMPVMQLAWWVQGQLAPGAVVQAVERDAHGRISVLAQEGWRISYAYEPGDAPDGRLRRLELAREGQEIRLVIDAWRRGAETP